MPRGSNPGERRGGRQPGTPNKSTKDLRERIAERMGESWCPILCLAELAESKDLPVDLRLRALAEIAPYIHARRRPQPGPEDTIGLETLVSSAVSISVITGVTPPDPHPVAATPAALAALEPSPAIPATRAPRPTRPPLRLALGDQDDHATTDNEYDPFTYNN